MNTRLRYSLDGTWQFYTDPAGELAPTSLASARLQLSVQAPAPWQSQSPALRHYQGVAWYEREIDLPADWPSGCLVLHFGAVDEQAEVWFNGRPVGRHAGGYLPFELDVTAHARPGRNRVTVRVSDLPEDFPEVPHGKQSWYGALSGIWQPVWLELRPPAYIDRVQITPADEQVQAQVTLNGPLPQGATFCYEVFSPHGECVASQVTPAPAVTLAVPAPLLWDLDTPRLYSLRVSLQGTEADSIEETFGFRTFTARDGQFFLNGRPLYLRGALDQDYYPQDICTPPSEDYIEAQFRQAKEMGLNCLRIHIKVADPRYYAAADRLGLLVWTELPNWINLTPTTRQRARSTLEGMVARDWNHPSIVIRTLINESWGLDLTDPEQRAWLVENFHFLKRLDPSRLVVGNSPCWGNHQVVTDIEDFHYYRAMPDHADGWREWVESLASRPTWTFAPRYPGYTDWKKFMLAPWTFAMPGHAPEVERRGDEPLVVSEFGNWGLPDVQKLYDAYGGEPWWFETGSEWGRGIVYPHGMEERFYNYHLDRRFSSLAALTEATQRLQFDGLKYEIEQIRRQPNLAGYIITEFTDVHWECNGLLDMCRNPKVFYDQLKDLNRDDLLIPAAGRLAFWEGETCSVDLLFSHYSAADLAGSRCEWRLAAGPSEAQAPHPINGLPSGEWTDLDPQPATVTPLGQVRFRVPRLEASQRVRLEFCLRDRHGQERASNFLDLYFFPAALRCAPAGRLWAPDGLAPLLERLGCEPAAGPEDCDLAVVTTLTDPLREFMLGGGRVLWLAEGRWAQRTYLGEVKLRRRLESAWQGDWVSAWSWLDRARLGRELPGEEALVDFLFHGLTPEMVITGIQQHEFRHRVHAGMVTGWLHKPVALVAERRVGRGRLLISTFRLRAGLARRNPVAQLLFQDLAALAMAGEPA